MDDRLPGQCDRCVLLLNDGVRFFFCDAGGVPTITTYGRGNALYHHPQSLAQSCPCSRCSECRVIAYRKGLIPKTLMDAMCENEAYADDLKDLLSGGE
jgi:hypothetical protein